MPLTGQRHHSQNVTHFPQYLLRRANITTSFASSNNLLSNSTATVIAVGVLKSFIECGQKRVN
jgi:hypothetical protein